MKKKYFISIITILVALVMIVFLRFEDAKKLFQSLQDKRKEKPLRPIVLEGNLSEEESNEKQKNLPLRKQRKSVTDRIPLNVDKIKEMRESGMTLQEIADKMGVSASTIGNRLRELKEKE